MQSEITSRMAGRKQVAIVLFLAIYLTSNGSVFVSGVYENDEECASYDHPTYGNVGQCMSTSQCPGVYISNLCPNHPAGVKCCFWNDEECAAYDHPTYGRVGQCLSTSQCPGGNYISNLCPSHPAGVKCCFIENEQECATYDHPDYGLSGQCMYTSYCPDSEYISGLCPSQPAGVRCCFTGGFPWLAPEPSGDPCSEVTFISREAWGARTPNGIENLPATPTYVFIHHTTGPTCSTAAYCESRVRGIQDYHMDDRNYDDIGYSFLVGGNGNIYVGRGWDRVGGHTYGYNDQGIAFSFIGDFSSVLPNQVALDAVKNAIQCGVESGYLSSSYELKGHRDVGTTACPGDTLYNEIQNWPNYSP